MTKPSRRRFLSFAAAASAVGPLTTSHAAVPRWVWRGRALGAEAELILCHPNADWARRAVAICVSEIDRLEDEFNLFRPASAIARLNKFGRLDQPSQDFRRCLGLALEIGARSNFMFDPTVQPLFVLFDRVPNPDQNKIDAALALVDGRDIDLSATSIRLPRAGMALTLNGIAQGWITDRLTGLLRDLGFDQALVNAGEIAAIGYDSTDRLWRIALDHVRRPGLVIDLDSQAVATSAGGGTKLDPMGYRNHLFDPRDGRSPPPDRTVSVITKTAALADGLSTALAVTPDAQWPRLLAGLDAKVLASGPAL